MIRQITCMLLACAIALWLLPAQQVHAIDSLKIVSIDPESGQTVKTGEAFRVKLHYNLTSRDTARVSFWVIHEATPDTIGSKGVTLSQSTVEKGEGDITCSISFPTFACVKYIQTMLDFEGKDLVSQDRHVHLLWVDPRFENVKPDPAFDTISFIEVNKQFPHVEELYDLVLSNGAVNLPWFWFNISPQRWEMTVGTSVCAAATQKILADCLKCTPDIYNIRIDNQAYVRGKVMIGGCYPDTGAPAMPAKLLQKLVQPDTTEQEFKRLINEWNDSNVRKKEEEQRQRALSRNASSTNMNDLFGAFSMETNSIPAGIPTNGLIAYYKLDGDGIDSTGIGKAAELNGGTKFEQHGLYLNGRYFTDSYTAIIPVVCLRYEQFTVSLNFKPIDFLEIDDGTSGHTRRFNIVTGGQTRWFALRRSNKGKLELALNNLDFRHELDSKPIPTNEWNTVTCAFDLPKRSVLIYFDGEALPEVQLPADFHLEVIGSANHNSDKAFMFTNYGNGEVLHGYVRNFIVYDRALPKDELGKLHKQLDEATGRPASGKETGKQP